MAPPTQAEIQAQRVSVELDKQKIELQKEINELNKQKNIAYRDYLEKLKTGSDKEKEAARRNLQNLEDEIDKQQKLNKEIDEQKKRIEASDKAVKDLSDSFSKLFEIAGNQKAPDIKQMFNIQNAIKGVEDLKKKFQAIAGPGGIGVGGALAKMGAAGLQAYAQAAVNLAIDLGTMETEFMKATGASQDFARSITLLPQKLLKQHKHYTQHSQISQWFLISKERASLRLLLSWTNLVYLIRHLLKPFSYQQRLLVCLLLRQNRQCLIWKSLLKI
jgi:hypothetical protein